MKKRLFVMLASRVENLKESSTVKSAALVAELRKKGMNVISFGMGEPDFTTPENIIEAAKRALDRGFTHYTPSNGIPELREAIAEKCRRENGLDCTFENVVVMPSKQAIFAAMFAIANKNDTILLPDPGWVTYPACASLCRASVEHYSGFCLKSEEIEKIIEKVEEKGKKIKLMVINTPSNPTGAVYDEGELKKIAAIAEEKSFYILSDEVYEKLIYEGKHTSIGKFCRDRVITVNGFSKTYAMTGWRLGWCIAHEGVLDAVKKINQHTQTCATSFGQWGALEALKGDQESIKRMKREFKKRRDFAFKRVSETGKLKCELPKGAFYLFPRYDCDMNSQEFCDKMLKEANVLLTQGSAFGENGEKHFRMSYAASIEHIERGIERIERVLEK